MLVVLTLCVSLRRGELLVGVGIGGDVVFGDLR